ncbi:hypothetical protein H671_2g4468 [Cricetulus griseus]|nr:hypothetical protein H671_2g4468 [Cricetulus griseus]
MCFSLTILRNLSIPANFQTIRQNACQPPGVTLQAEGRMGDGRMESLALASVGSLLCVAPACTLPTDLTTFPPPSTDLENNEMGLLALLQNKNIQFTVYYMKDVNESTDMESTNPSWNTEEKPCLLLFSKTSSTILTGMERVDNFVLFLI